MTSREPEKGAAVRRALFVVAARALLQGCTQRQAYEAAVGRPVSSPAASNWWARWGTHVEAEVNRLLEPVSERVQAAIGAAADMVRKKCEDGADDACKAVESFGRLIGPALRADTTRETAVIAAGTSDLQTLRAIAERHVPVAQTPALPPQAQEEAGP